MVDTGKEVYKVVCGAKNVIPKRIVALAIKGARLADGQ
jgi:tRNA-binding EMAP/Myf-like protein